MSDAKENKVSKKRIAVVIIGNSVIWGVVIVLTSLMVKGSGLMGKLIPVMALGSVSSIMLLASLFSKGEK